MHKKKGTGLPEVLICLFLTTLIFSVLMQIYLSHKRQYLQDQARFELDFDLNWIADLMRESIMLAGFSPCMSLDALETRDRRYADEPIQPLKIITNPLPEARIIYMSLHFSRLQRSQGARHLWVSKGLSYKPGQSLLIADCYHAEAHEIKQVSKKTEGLLIELKKPLIFDYPERSYVGELIDEGWLIHLDKKGHKALYLKAKQMEKLSSRINHLEINRQSRQHKQLLDVRLGVEGHTPFHFTIARRNL